MKKKRAWQQRLAGGVGRVDAQGVLQQHWQQQMRMKKMSQQIAGLVSWPRHCWREEEWQLEKAGRALAEAAVRKGPGLRAVGGQGAAMGAAAWGVEPAAGGSEKESVEGQAVVVGIAAWGLEH